MADSLRSEDNLVINAFEIFYREENSMAKDINRHITQTYINLRIGMAVIALLLPMLLIAGSWLSDKISFQESISAFYHTGMRNLFVGSLCAVGSFLYLYKGFNEKENIALNFAGVFALGVAFFPTTIPEGIKNASVNYLPDMPFTAPYLHGICAVLFFILIAYVCIACGKYTVALIEDEKTRKKYLNIYKVIGVLMVVFPVLAVVFTFRSAGDYWIFIFEFAAIWVFALFWIAKVKELDHQGIPMEHLVMENAKKK